MKQTDIDRSRLDADTAAFLAAGGEIEQVPYLHTNEERIQLVRREDSKERATYVSGKKGDFDK